MTPREILEYARRGGILTYDVDVSACDVKLPSTMRAYSFGETVQDVYMEFAGKGQWRLFTSSARPVNGSRLNVTGSVVRVTEVNLTPSDQEDDATAFVTLTDWQHGGDEKVLATGNITCKISNGGFLAHPQRVGDRELEQERDLKESFHMGMEMTFAVDLGTCTTSGKSKKVTRPGAPGGRLADNATEYWTGDIYGYRIPPIQEEAIEFTSILEGPRQREVLNVRVTGDNDVEVKSYAENHGPTPTPTPVLTYKCRMGSREGGFHVFTYTPRS